MTETPLRKPKTIPAFDNIEEEARFWDSHDTADFESSFDPVEVEFRRPLSEGITIRLSQETLSQLRSRANQKGLGPTTLARMWILDELRREEVHSGRRVRR